MEFDWELFQIHHKLTSQEMEDTKSYLKKWLMSSIFWKKWIFENFIAPHTGVGPQIVGEICF